MKVQYDSFRELTRVIATLDILKIPVILKLEISKSVTKNNKSDQTALLEKLLTLK